MARFSDLNQLITITTDTESLYTLRTAAQDHARTLARLTGTAGPRVRAIIYAINEIQAAMQEARIAGHTLPILYDPLNDDEPLGRRPA